MHESRTTNEYLLPISDHLATSNDLIQPSRIDVFLAQVWRDISSFSTILDCES